MLRKFFISLLILSALTSDGLVNLPINIYNIYFQLHKNVEICGLAAMQPQPSPMTAVLPAYDMDSAGFAAAENAAFVLSAESLEKLQGFPAANILEKDNLFYTDNTVTNFAYEYFSSYSKSIILNKADVSPPVC